MISDPQNKIVQLFRCRGQRIVQTPPLQVVECKARQLSLALHPAKQMA